MRISAKARVIRRFLTDFLPRYASLDKARIATLGGNGVEAAIWRELDVPRDNGWLIERSHKRSSELIHEFRYRTHNQLRTFDTILAGDGDSNRYVDSFHLDLRGTFSNSSMADFAPVLDLILKGSVRVLAITVADQRRNTVIEQWKEYAERGAARFKMPTKEILGRLLELQARIPANIRPLPSFFKPCDPIKAAKREFGLMVELAELLSIVSGPWSPVDIERYIYVSRESGTFRMRTYFFCFGTRSLADPMPAFADAWLDSNAFFVTEDGVAEVPFARRNEAHLKGAPMDSKSIDLTGFVAVPKDEYDRLVAARDNLAAIQTAVQAISGKVPLVENGKPMADAPAPAAGRPPKPHATKRGWNDLSDREKIEFQIQALEVRASNGGKFTDADWQNLLTVSFGHYDEALGRSCRSAVARASGGFREGFAASVKRVFGGDAKSFLDRLAKV